ncbi:MAG: DNRLRE domain-containing protein [bacterium]|nr:DNRLRE domain-containing protein [bacterium]
MCYTIYSGRKGVNIGNRLIVLFVVASLVSSVPVVADYVTCYRANDAYIRSDEPGANYDDSFLYHGRRASGVVYIPLMKFDLSPIPEFAEIEEARIEYHIATFGGESLGDTYFIMLMGEWSEYGVTYDDYPEVNGDVVVTVEWSCQEWINADCTEFVRRWCKGEVENNGVIGLIDEGDDECWYRVYSREYGDEGTNPRLIVKYRETNGSDRDGGRGVDEDIPGGGDSIVDGNRDGLVISKKRIDEEKTENNR